MLDRLENSLFRRAVELLDSGDEAALRAHLREHPDLIRERVPVDVSYFQNPALLEFVAENPVRNGTLPPNIVQIAKLLLEMGAKQDPLAVNETLQLVCSGRVPRECHVQIPLIDLLCDYGADPQQAVPAALPHGEFEAVNALLRRGARVDLSVAAGMGVIEPARDLVPDANSEDRHRALALASQFGHTEIVRLLLDAGEDPNRYNPARFHGHSTPLHQAAFAGHIETVKLLVARGARLDIQDTVWQGTPADWAMHAGRTDVAKYLG